MKKYITIFICSLLSFASLYAVWEGNGIAGVATDFTEDGMFVKSSLFPKYTLVEILNLENDLKVRSIVLEGSQDAGILMSFSPSVAEALKVPYGKVARIRVVSPSVVSEGEDSNVGDENIPTSFETEEEPVVEEVKPALVAKEEDLHIEVEDVKMEEKDLNGNSEVLLYDFKPISKTIEKKGKEEGAVSFDPAFIEEDISINLNIPEKSLDEKTEKEEFVPEKQEEKKEEIKKEELIPPKEPTIAPKIDKKEAKSGDVVPPPKEVTTVFKRDIYLETTGLRPPEDVVPPKDVASPKMQKKEEIPQIQDVISVDRIEVKKEDRKEEKEEDVKDVLTVEKKEESKKDVILIVDEVPQIEKRKEDVSGVADEKVISDVVTLKEIRKKEVKNDESEQVDESQGDGQAVEDAPPIKREGREEKEEDSPKVEEVMSPFSPMDRPNSKEEMDDVKEIGEVEKKENIKEDDSIAPVPIVDKPKGQTSEKNKDVADVLIVPSIKERVTEQTPEESPKEEKIEEPAGEELKDEEPEKEDEGARDPLEDNVEEQPQEEIDEVEEDDPMEEEVTEEAPLKETPIEEDVTEEEPLKKETQQINERPLREIEVHNTPHNRIEVDASKEDVKLNGKKKYSAIEDYDVKGNSASSNIKEKEKALDEVKVLPNQNEQEKQEKEAEIEPIVEEIEDVKEEPVVDEKEEEILEPIMEEKKEIEIKEEASPVIERAEKREEIKKEEVLPEVKEQKEKPVERNENNERFPIGKTISGYTYVQIAVYNSAIYVEDILKKYGSRYPVIIEKKGKNRYVVFIGPLQKHEAGAIQELFKGFGFSGCFVR